MANICVFCASSNGVEKIYEETAEEVGTLIGKNGHNLVYGGTNLGLMGIVARATKLAGGRTIGILPECWSHLAQGEDELISTACIRTRKAQMVAKSDAFICLPGGVGTLDEMAEYISEKYVGFHTKPLIILNINDYYKHVIAHYHHICSEGFAKDVANLYHIAEKPSDVLDLISVNC